MIILAEQTLEMKPSENIWDAIAADLAAVTAATDGPEEGQENLEENLEGKDNKLSSHRDKFQMVQQDLADINISLDRSYLPNDAIKEMEMDPSGNNSLGDDRNELLPDQAVRRIAFDHPLAGERCSGQKIDGNSNTGTQLNKDDPASKRGDDLSSTHVGVEDVFPESTDEDGDNHRDDDGEKQSRGQDNILGKRNRTSDERVSRYSGKKPNRSLPLVTEDEEFSKKDQDANPTQAILMVEELEGQGQSVAKSQDLRYKSERMETQSGNAQLPPGLEKLHRVFTSLNAACGFLQKQQMSSSWQNVNQALQQLSGTEGEDISVEDIRRLAQLCPGMVNLSHMKGEGEEISFYVELIDPSDPIIPEQLSMIAGTSATDQQANVSSEVLSVGKQISDPEARLIVERRQKAFLIVLAQLGQQSQVLKTNLVPLDGDEHSKNFLGHPSMQRHRNNEGHHPMGPAILALPTQNLVLTSPPVLSQQLQPGFMNISSGYHGIPFPIQMQPGNAYTSYGSFTQPKGNKYPGYQLGSLPSTSQPSPLHVSHRAQCTLTPPVVDLSDATNTPEPSPFYHAQSVNKAKRRRSRNWDTWEIVLLVQAKKNEWERSETSSGRDRFETSGERWKKVEKFLTENKVVGRDAIACKNKWESLLSDYKAIKDWNRTPGNTAYGSLTPGEKKAANLPAVFASNLVDLMDTFQGKLAHISPPSVVDSFVRNTPAGSVGAESGDGSGAEESTDALPCAPHGGDPMHGSFGKRKKSQGGCSPLVAAFDRMTATMINIEKGRDERSERLLTLENKKYELERIKFELQARKLETEREDRKGLVRVLGNLAGAFHRMADKM